MLTASTTSRMRGGSAIIMQRVADEEVEVRHVSDVENPADFLTKRVSKEKARASMYYLTGAWLP